MSDEQHKVEMPEQTSFIGRLARYAQISLLMVVIVYLIWAVGGGIDAQLVASEHPEIASQLVLLEKHGFTEQNLMSILTLLNPHMHWFGLALFSSLVSFTLVGIMVGRWTDNPSWAGALPIIDLVAGFNPVLLGGAPNLIGRLTLGQQTAVLILQVVVVHNVAQAVFIKRLLKKKCQLNEDAHRIDKTDG